MRLPGGGEGGHCLVTGAAGFIGSRLAERLLSLGHTVVGLDAFTDYYARDLKQRNLEGLFGTPGFAFVEGSLLDVDLSRVLNGVDYIFHFAAQPGVRKSWGRTFASYVDHNVLATQRLLEAASRLPIRRFVYASSSSVYGNADELPVRESTLPRPVSPYGVTKLAAEHLCGLYANAFAVPIVSLRYFTVYGPRQRPDMAFNRFVEGILREREIVVYGDGEQTRDFTFVEDAVAAAISAAHGALDAPWGRYFNIGGEARVTVNQVIALIESLTGKTARIRRLPAQPGDARHTFADCSAARAALRYRPAWTLERGLGRMVEWQAAQPVGVA